MRVASFGEASREVGRKAPVGLKFDINIDIVWFERATSERSEDLQARHKAYWPFNLAFIERSQEIFQEQQRAFPFHHASVALRLIWARLTGSPKFL